MAIPQTPASTATRTVRLVEVFRVRCGSGYIYSETPSYTQTERDAKPLECATYEEALRLAARTAAACHPGVEFSIEKTFRSEEVPDA